MIQIGSERKINKIIINNSDYLNYPKNFIKTARYNMYNNN